MDNMYISIAFDEGKMTIEELENYIQFIKKEYQNYNIVVFDGLSKDSMFFNVLSKHFKNRKNYTNKKEMYVDLNENLGFAFFLGFVLNESKGSQVEEELQFAYKTLDHLRIRQVILDYNEEGDECND